MQACLCLAPGAREAWAGEGRGQCSSPSFLQLKTFSSIGGTVGVLTWGLGVGGRAHALAQWLLYRLAVHAEPPWALKPAVPSPPMALWLKVPVSRSQGLGKSSGGKQVPMCSPRPASHNPVSLAALPAPVPGKVPSGRPVCMEHGAL